MRAIEANIKLAEIPSEMALQDTCERSRQWYGRLLATATHRLPLDLGNGTGMDAAAADGSPAWHHATGCMMRARQMQHFAGVVGEANEQHTR